MHIPHHSFDKQKIEDYYLIELQSIELSKTIFNKGKYFVLRDMYNETLSAFCCSVILNRSKDEIRNNFNLFFEVVIGKYKMGTNIGSEISFSFLGKSYNYIPEDKNYTLTDQGWITAWFSTLLFLDIEKISELNSINLEKVMEVTNVKGHEYTYLYAKFLQHVFKSDQNNFDSLKKVSDSINSDDIPSAIKNFATDIIGGEVDLFWAALLKETPYFNQVYLTVVEWHKNFYKSESQNCEGLFSIPLTAITVLAKRYGITIEHTSDYIPEIFFI